jgi:hypothetical protein
MRSNEDVWVRRVCRICIRLGRGPYAAAHPLVLCAGSVGMISKALTRHFEQIYEFI